MAAPAEQPPPLADSGPAASTSSVPAPDAAAPSPASAPAPTSARVTVVTSPTDDEISGLVTAFEAYDFGADGEFRAGLPAIIKAVKGKGPTSASKIDEVIARAQWFYFTRKQGLSVQFEAYLRNRTGETESVPMKSPLSPPARDLPEETPPPSFGSLEGVSVSHPGASAPAANVPKASLASASAPTSDSASAPTTSAQPPGASSAAAAPSDETQPLTAASVIPSDAPAPATFNDVVRLIAEGRAHEVPVMHIPDGLNLDEPSVSTMKARPKPWETAQAQVGGTEQGQPLPPSSECPSYEHAQEGISVQAAPSGNGSVEVEQVAQGVARIDTSE